MNHRMNMRLTVCLIALSMVVGFTSAEEEKSRSYENNLRLLENPEPIMGDYPHFVAPVVEIRRYEAPLLVNDKDADIDVRAWRFSYNARGIIEIPNKLNASKTAVIVVHPWGIDDAQGWRTPEPAGVADFCTPSKNHLSHEHITEVLNPFIQSMRGKAALIMYSQRGGEDPIREKVYRSIRKTPSAAERKEGYAELLKKLADFDYNAEDLPKKLSISNSTAVKDYFAQFPGLDAGPKYNGEGYWDLPVPVVDSIDAKPEDIVVYDEDGYEVLKEFLKEKGVQNILLTGYATDMCFKSTTAGYDNLSKDFNVFLVGDATLATFPANKSPAHATNAALSFASLNQLITQVSWITIKD